MMRVEVGQSLNQPRSKSTHPALPARFAAARELVLKYFALPQEIRTTRFEAAPFVAQLSH
jgi:hypothetical protein